LPSRCAKLAREFDPENRYDKVDYVAKVDELMKKFDTFAWTTAEQLSFMEPHWEIMSNGALSRQE